MAYIGTTPTKVVSRQSAVNYRYIATEGQTAFTGADLNNQVLACNPADMDVYLNGVRLDLTDWSATATILTLAVAATAGDEITVTVRQTFEVADTYTKTTADDRFVNAAGDTMTGTLSVISGANGRINIGSTNNYLYGDSVGNFIVGTSGSDKMQIDASGRITKPYQPSFLAYGSKTKTANIWETVSDGFTTIAYNTGNHYNTSNGRFTAPVSGKYYFYAGGYSPNATNGARYAWSITVNAGPQFFMSGSNYSTVDTPLSSHSIIFNLNAGDFVKVDMYSEIFAIIGNATHAAYFGGYLIG